MANNAERLQFLLSHEEGFTRSRLPALYSDFRSMRTTNPEGYAANIAVWRRALASLVRWGMLPAAPAKGTPASGADVPGTAETARSLIILAAGPQLRDALRSDRYGLPDALDAVIQEAVRDRDLVPLASFLTATESIYGRRPWPSVTSLPWSVVSWGLQRLGVVDAIRIPSEQFVVVANVEAAAAAFAEKTAGLLSRFERTWSVAQFKREFGRPGAIWEATGDSAGAAGEATAPLRLSDTDLDALLVFLSRDKGLVAYDGHVVTLLGGNDKGRTTKLTEEDRAVAQVRELLDALTHQTTVLSRRIDELADAARDAVQRQNRVTAKAALRLKKQAETALAARFATLGQLEATAVRLEEAADAVQVVAAMAASADALAALNAQVGGAAGVESVAERLRVQMDAADEIGCILAEATPSAAAVALEGVDLDGELAALEAQERAKTAAAHEAARDAADRTAAEDTKRRLAAIEPVPASPALAAADAAADAALEEATTASLRAMTLEGPLAG